MKPIRLIRIEEDVAFIPLTRGYEAVISVEDVSLVGEWLWYSQLDGNTVYAVRNDRSGCKPKTVYMHRLIMDEPAGEVDHRDGDGLNNRRMNLRIATGSQNRQNSRLSKRNTSGFKGVSYFERRGKWQAHIGIKGRTKFLGLFDSPEDAHVAYCKASAELHGNFGRTV